MTGGNWAQRISVIDLLEVEELAEKAEREAETATRTVEDFEIKGAAAVKKSINAFSQSCMSLIRF